MKNLITLLLGALLLSASAQADIPSTHGMLLFGDETSYVSHLPMFHQPHDYQLIMQIEIEDLPRGQIAEIYENLKVDAETYFTIVPEVMDLTDVINGDKTSFEAVIYLGHFERGGQKIGKVQFNISNILLATQLDGDQEPSEEQYFLFGDEDEIYAAHIIQAKPSFDKIMLVELNDESFDILDVIYFEEDELSF